jgi:hypothetical protein
VRFFGTVFSITRFPGTKHNTDVVHPYNTDFTEFSVNYHYLKYLRPRVVTAYNTTLSMTVWIFDFSFFMYLMCITTPYTGNICRVPEYCNANAALDLSKEDFIKLQRQIWTTHTNLNDWFDSWEAFLVSQGFETEITREDGAGKEV